jgi:hypothetical protein
LASDGGWSVDGCIGGGISVRIEPELSVVKGAAAFDVDRRLLVVLFLCVLGSVVGG